MRRPFLPDPVWITRMAALGDEDDERNCDGGQQDSEYKSPLQSGELTFWCERIGGIS